MSSGCFGVLAGMGPPVGGSALLRMVGKSIPQDGPPLGGVPRERVGNTNNARMRAVHASLGRYRHQTQGDSNLSRSPLLKHYLGGIGKKPHNLLDIIPLVRLSIMP